MITAPAIPYDEDEDVAVTLALAEQGVYLTWLSHAGRGPIGVLLVRRAPHTHGTPQPAPGVLRWGTFNEELANAGVLLAGEGLHPSARGKRVTFSGDACTVIDGPFSETKGLIAGFWLWQCRSMDEALQWAKRVPFHEGEIEIRQVFDAADFGAEFTPELQAREERLRAQSAQRAHEAH